MKGLKKLVKLPIKFYATPVKKRNKELREAIKLKKITTLSWKRLLSETKRIANWPQPRET